MTTVPVEMLQRTIIAFLIAFPTTFIVFCCFMKFESMKMRLFAPRVTPTGRRREQNIQSVTEYVEPPPIYDVAKSMPEPNTLDRLAFDMGIRRVGGASDKKWDKLLDLYEQKKAKRKKRPPISTASAQTQTDEGDHTAIEMGTTSHCQATQSQCRGGDMCDTCSVTVSMDSDSDSSLPSYEHALGMLESATECEDVHLQTSL